jgi:hypothetical protein
MDGGGDIDGDDIGDCIGGDGDGDGAVRLLVKNGVLDACCDEDDDDDTVDVNDLYIDDLAPLAKLVDSEGCSNLTNGDVGIDNGVDGVADVVVAPLPLPPLVNITGDER